MLYTCVVHSMRIGLASPDKSRDWAEGEGTKTETSNERTENPERTVRKILKIPDCLLAIFFLPCIMQYKKSKEECFMAYEWSDSPVATLSVKKSNSGTDRFTFQGVSTDAQAGSPQNFLDAVNHLLAFGGQSAVLEGIQRTVKQEGVEE